VRFVSSEARDGPDETGQGGNLQVLDELTDVAFETGQGTFTHLRSNVGLH
jgi:hypothetical protein